MRVQMGNVREKFAAALDELVAEVKTDRSVLAAILCGSLAHDVVWEKSDIDLALVTVDDKKAEVSHLSLNAGGVNVHVFMMPRAEFREMAEGAVRNSFMHSMLAKGNLLYTHDETIARLCANLHGIGERDRQIQLLVSATSALPSVYKAHKWLLTRGDLNYTALWILYAANSLARTEVIAAGLLADREVMPQAMKLNPAFFKIVYADLLNMKKTRPVVQAALDAIDEYLAQRSATLFRLVLGYLRDARDARSCSEIETWFKRNLDVVGVTTACEYLADQGLIGKVSLPVRITKKSNISVAEMAFVHLGDPPDEF